MITQSRRKTNQNTDSFFIINSVKPTAINDAVKFDSKAKISSINYFPNCSKIQYDENQFIILNHHKAVKFNLKVVNLYKEVQY